MSKFTSAEKETVKSVVARLSIKRIPNHQIIAEVYHQTGKTVTTKTLWNIRQQIKRESYDWYSRLREGNYEYIHEFKERINEIQDLMYRHNEIIDKYPNNPSIQQKSLEELHRLNITLSNYYDIAPSIIGYSNNTGNKNDNTIPIPQQNKQEIIL